MRAPSVVADNSKPSDIGPEPSGFWSSVHAQAQAWADKFAEGQDDDGNTD